MKFTPHVALIVLKLIEGKEVLAHIKETEIFCKQLAEHANKVIARMERVYASSRALDDPWLEATYLLYLQIKGRRIYFLESTDEWTAAIYMPPAGQIPEDYKGEKLI